MNEPRQDSPGHFERAYEEYWLPVFRIAAAWTNDLGAAEDIAQEAFVRLWLHRDTFDWNSPALPWLLVTAKRLAASRLRRLRRLLASPPAELSLGGVDAWLDTQRALGRLRPRERTALLAVAVMDIPPSDIAAVLEISEGAVRALISRARRKLRESR